MKNMDTNFGNVQKTGAKATFGFNALRLFAICTILMLSVISLSALTLINENIQNWTAHASYGNFTQEIPAGTVTLTACLVQPGAAASGTGSAGRIQCQATNAIVEFPVLASVGQVEFHFAAGSSGRSIKLQKLVDATWEDITTFTGIAATGATFNYDVNLSVPTTLRLQNQSNAVYIYDIIVTDFQSSELPIVTTSDVSNVTYNTAVCGGNVQFGGTSAVTAKGVCWSTGTDPTISDAFTSDGSGIGVFTSTITGLIADTDYFARAYATNTSGTAYGEAIPFHSGNIGIPSTQATNLAFYPGNNSIQATWTPGNGAKRIVKFNTTNNFTLPVNGINYPANAVYTGSGEQVIYNDATIIVEGVGVNSVTVSGLTPNTTYWFRIFDYNGATTEIQYNTLTATNNPRSATTTNSIINGYYTGITGTGVTLKNNLHTLIQNTHLTEFTYDGVWTQLQYTDEDSTNTNNIIEEYTGWSVPKNNNGGGVSQWNREHTWSKSHGDFGEVAPAGTDLHHLRPADCTVNSSKGNKDFDDGGTPVTDNSPYTGYTGVTGCYTDTDSWEPRAVEKGDIARMILYMATRYDATDTSYNLEMQDATPTSGPFYGKLSTLLKWHVQDPPDSWEIRRNNRIQERQGNRNPYIDHPEFVNMIWAPTTVNATGVDSVSFTANWTPAVNATAYYLDVASDNQFTSYVTGYHDLNVNSTTSRAITGLPGNHTYYYRLRSFFTSGYSMYSNVMPVVLTNASVVYSAFTATWPAPEDFLVHLNWTTQSENNLLGFEVYQSMSDTLSTAQNITPQVISATNSGSPVNYSFIDPTFYAYTYVFYWIKSLNMNGSSQFYGPTTVYVGGVSNNDPVQVISPVSISRIYPNPFSSNAAIEVKLAKSDNITLSVYNLKGQCVRNLYNGVKASGTTGFNWNGKDNHGLACSPGVYIIRLDNGKLTHQKKVLMY